MNDVIIRIVIDIFAHIPAYFVFYLYGKSR